VAKTRCLMSRRKSKFSPKEALSLDALMPDKKELADLSQKAPDNPETAAVRRESARRLRDAVRKLPPEYRLVLVLRDMEELSDGDVAEITGLKPGTVRVRLHRARLFVRKELERSATAKQSSGLPAAALKPKRERSCKQMFAQLSDYLDQELDDSLCDELEKHMDGCEPCQAFLTSLQHSIEQCRSTPAEEMDPTWAAKLRRTVLAQYQTALSGSLRLH
jgi:RNA polymerase sigma-70 factor, ECF subfamily